MSKNNLPHSSRSSLKLQLLPTLQNDFCDKKSQNRRQRALPREHFVYHNISQLSYQK